MNNQPTFNMRNLKTATLNNHPIQESAPACAARSKSILKDSQTDSRNPFKKSSTLKQSGGGGAMHWSEDLVLKL